MSNDPSVETKAELCMRIASRILNNTPNWPIVEDQALDLMTMTNEAVVETARRIGIQLVVTQPSQVPEQELAPVQVLIRDLQRIING
jgi:hypothetical protein